MRVISFVSQKGGSGKTTLISALHQSTVSPTGCATSALEQYIDAYTEGRCVVRAAPPPAAGGR